MFRKILIFFAAAAVTSIFYINFCALAFQCGCHSLWAGADAACNIHHAGARHCPWCAQSPVWPAAAMFGSQAAISFWPGQRNWGLRLAAALAAFPVAGGIVAAIHGHLTGYWN